jgi:methylated-DNA-[protein]-cysteine S-methyltransferase
MKTPTIELGSGRATAGSARRATSSRVVKTAVGPLVLSASDEGLTHLDLPGKGTAAATEGSPASSAHLDRAVRQLDEYFAGSRTSFDLDLSPAGTDFQRSVWFALADIPYGETISYAELAQWVGRPRAFRAVGQANGANPLAIILPCHRVIASGGGIGGYGGGLDLKRWLLAHEAECEGD